jgi:hypothetical protein
MTLNFTPPRIPGWLVRSALVTASALGLLTLGHAPIEASQRLTVVGFNVESGGAEPTILAEQLGPLQGVDIWGFSEVADESWAAILELAAEFDEVGNPDYSYILGSTGGGDRLAIVYNRDRFDLVSVEELDEINPGGRVRSPLVAHFREQESGEEFLFMVNHLYRSDASARHEQARLLNQWATEQTLPIIAVGDYNFDWDIPSNGQQRDRGYDYFTANDVFDWIEPVAMLQTFCSTRFNSILDFVFVANAPWEATSEVLFPEADYCPDTRETSDHRPVQAEFVLVQVTESEAEAEDTGEAPAPEQSPEESPEDSPEEPTGATGGDEPEATPEETSESEPAEADASAEEETDEETDEEDSLTEQIRRRIEEIESELEDLRDLLNDIL